MALGFASTRPVPAAAAVADAALLHLRLEFAESICRISPVSTHVTHSHAAQRVYYILPSCRRTHLPNASACDCRLSTPATTGVRSGRVLFHLVGSGLTEIQRGGAGRLSLRWDSGHFREVVKYTVRPGDSEGKKKLVKRHCYTQFRLI